MKFNKVKFLLILSQISFRSILEYKEHSKNRHNFALSSQYLRKSVVNKVIKMIGRPRGKKRGPKNVKCKDTEVVIVVLQIVTIM